MKQFMLTEFNEFNGVYQVWFGNRMCVEFASKRHMRAFLAETNKFLTGKMIELNQLYCTFFNEYRCAWFIMKNVKNGRPVNMQETEQRLQKIITDIMDQFNRCGNTYTGAASGAWSFIHLQNICWMLIDGNEILSGINKARNNTIQYHNLQILNDRINLLADCLGNYPDQLPENALRMHSNK